MFFIGEGSMRGCGIMCVYGFASSTNSTGLLLNHQLLQFLLRLIRVLARLAVTIMEPQKANECLAERAEILREIIIIKTSLAHDLIWSLLCSGQAAAFNKVVRTC